MIRTVVCLVLVGTLAGCGGQAYLMKSAAAKNDIAEQLGIILAEYNTATVTDLAAAETATFSALKASIKAEPDKVDEKVDKAAALLAIINEKRAWEAERYAIGQRHLAFLKKLAAQDAAIVLRQTNDLDQLRELAEKAWAVASKGGD
jgi:uncharacterized lipoprotein YehR (DUF1307 family)